MTLFYLTSKAKIVAVSMLYLIFFTYFYFINQVGCWSVCPIRCACPSTHILFQQHNTKSFNINMYLIYIFFFCQLIIFTLMLIDTFVRRKRDN